MLPLPRYVSLEKVMVPEIWAYFSRVVFLGFLLEETGRSGNNDNGSPIAHHT